MISLDVEGNENGKHGRNLIWYMLQGMRWKHTIIQATAVTNNQEIKKIIIIEKKIDGKYWPIPPIKFNPINLFSLAIRLLLEKNKCAVMGLKYFG